MRQTHAKRNNRICNRLASAISVRCFTHEAAEFAFRGSRVRTSKSSTVIYGTPSREKDASSRLDDRPRIRSFFFSPSYRVRASWCSNYAPRIEVDCLLKLPTVFLNSVFKHFLSRVVNYMFVLASYVKNFFFHIEHISLETQNTHVLLFNGCVISPLRLKWSRIKIFTPRS